MSNLGDDDVLLEALASAFSANDPVPESARRFAIESRRMLVFDAEFAVIVADSLVDAANSRSGGRVRTVEFASSAFAFRVECGDDLVGSISPFPSGTQARIQWSDGRFNELDVSETGFFVFDQPLGQFRIVVESAAGSVTTDWIHI